MIARDDVIKIFANRILSWISLDIPLITGIGLLLVFGLLILTSASDMSTATVFKQSSRFILAFGIFLVCAQIPPHKYKLLAPWLFGASLCLLFFVFALGAISNGAQRWLDMGLLRFQPSEFMKITLPLILARYFDDKRLPPTMKNLAICGVLIMVPAILIALQPDLGTALMVLLSGFLVIFFAELSWRIMATGAVSSALMAPILWHFMHSYQRDRVLIFLNPERDPLGAGYQIIQSKIALGSGGFLGKGWLHGTQAHLQFLPKHATDFIFAVCGEELGFLGCVLLLSFFVYIFARGLYVCFNSNDTFTRLLASSLTFTFCLSFLVNIGMVTGILPVVGLPLPLVSYGGSSMIVSMMAFGILTSIYTHKKLL